MSSAATFFRAGKDVTLFSDSFQINNHSFEIFINNMPEVHQYAFLCHYPELGYMVHNPSQRIKALITMEKL